jgi:hypothetical protein
MFTAGEIVRLNQYIHDFRNFYVSAMFHPKIHKYIVFVSLRLISIENIYFLHTFACYETSGNRILVAAYRVH